MVSANLVYSITYARKKMAISNIVLLIRGVGWHLRGYVAAAAYLRGLWGKNTGMFGGIILPRKNSAKNKRFFFFTCV